MRFLLKRKAEQDAQMKEESPRRANARPPGRMKMGDLDGFEKMGVDPLRNKRPLIRLAL